MGEAQIVFVLLSILGFGIICNKHGKPRDNYNVWTYLIGSTINYLILIWGGFFG